MACRGRGSASEIGIRTKRPRFTRLMSVAHHRQLRRVDEIVGGVDREERPRDAFEVRRGVVVFRRAEVVDHVVGVGRLDPRRRPATRGTCRRPRRSGTAAATGAARSSPSAETRWRSPCRAAARCSCPPFHVRIGDDRVDERLAPDAVAPGDLDGIARERHETVRELRDTCSPTSTCASPPSTCPITSRRRDRPSPSVTSSCCSLHHVGVAVLRELHPQAVARLGSTRRARRCRAG